MMLKFMLIIELELEIEYLEGWSIHWKSNVQTVVSVAWTARRKIINPVRLLW